MSVTACDCSCVACALRRAGGCPAFGLQRLWGGVLRLHACETQQCVLAAGKCPQQKMTIKGNPVIYLEPSIIRRTPLKQNQHPFFVKCSE